MSLPVDLSALRERIAEYGDAAFLVTVNDDRSAHVVSVSVRCDGDRLVVPAGRRTRANAESVPTVTLLWPPRPDPAYSLIVDATLDAPAGDGDLALLPRSAVLHRVAGAPGDGPTCLPVAEPATGG